MPSLFLRTAPMPTLRTAWMFALVSGTMPVPTPAPKTMLIQDSTHTTQSRSQQLRSCSQDLDPSHNGHDPCRSWSCLWSRSSSRPNRSWRCLLLTPILPPWMMDIGSPRRIFIGCWFPVSCNGHAVHNQPIKIWIREATSWSLVLDDVSAHLKCGTRLCLPWEFSVPVDLVTHECLFPAYRVATFPEKRSESGPWTPRSGPYPVKIWVPRTNECFYCMRSPFSSPLFVYPIKGFCAWSSYLCLRLGHKVFRNTLQCLPFIQKLIVIPGNITKFK